MLCHQCGTPVSATDSTCQNCHAELKRGIGRTKLRSEGLKRMTQQLRAIQVEDRYFPPNEDVSERFILGELVGRGPFGEVYRAHDSLIDAQVALKIFAPELIETPHAQERFLKVARTARTLTQPNVIRVHSSGVHKGHAWVSMQALDGLSLRKVMKMRRQRREHFPLDEIEPILNQLIRAAGHVHREFPIGNLKPANIIVMPELIKLTDHYLLAAFDSREVAARLSDSRYLAPELRALKDKTVDVGELDPRCDIYSLGMIIGEMVFGPDYTPGATDAASSPLDALCRRACAQDPAERYESFEALSEDFSTLIDTGALLVGAPGAHEIAENEPTHVISRPVGPPPAPGARGEDGDEGAAEPAQAAEPVLEEPAPEEPPAQVEVLDIPVAVDEDVATREYVRDVDDDDLELGDLLATNEVLRENRKMKSPVAAKRSPDPKRVPVAPTLTSVAPKEPTTTSVLPAPPTQTADSGPSPGAILAGLLALLLIGGVIFWMGRSEPTEPVELGDASAAAAIEAAKTGAETPAAAANTPEKDAADSATEKLSAQVSAAQAEAERAVREANAEALASAQASAEQAQAAGDEQAQAATSAVALAATAPSAAERSDGARPADAKAPADKAPADKANANAPAAQGAASSPTAAAKSAAKPADKPADKPAAAGTTCPGGMRLIKAKAGNYCIDAYEHPGRGAKPTTNVSWFKAQQLCEARGARLCKQQEWRSACGGKYPYGSTWDPDSCNTVDEDEFERSLAAAGSFAKCKGRSGTYDMVGNVHEWVAEQRIAGGGFDSGADVAQCGYSSAKAPGSGGANIGFRCCADPQ